jgi:hypothetical protein
MPHVVVHTLAETCAALQAAAETQNRLTLLSPPSAAQSMGAGYFLAMVKTAQRRIPEAKCLAVLDCGTAPGLALAALRAGAKAIRLVGTPSILRKVSEIAGQSGATVLDTSPQHVLDLRDVIAPLAATRNFLAGVMEPPQNN